MAQYYQGQGQQQQQPTFQPVYQQPQNIYQQLGKPQPQPHLQSPPQQGFQFTNQQYQTAPFASPPSPFPPSQTPYQPPTTPYQPSHTPYPTSGTPYPPPQTPFAQPQAPYQLTQTPYAPPPAQTPQYQQQQPQYVVQQLPPAQQHVLPPRTPVHVPTSSFPNRAPSAVPTSSTWRPPPIAPSASLAQQAQQQHQYLQQQQQQQQQQHQQQVVPVQQRQQHLPPLQTNIPPRISPQPSPLQSNHPPRISPQPSPSQMQSQPLSQFQPPSQMQSQPPATPLKSQPSTRRPLPQPSPGANAQTPALPPVLSRVPTLAAMQAQPSTSSRSVPQTASQISNTPSKPFTHQSTASIPNIPTTKTPSPTRNSRPLPTPAGGSKRATVDLGKLPSSAFAPFQGSGSGFPRSGDSNGAAPTMSAFEALGLARTRSESPTKSTLPAPPALSTPSKSVDGVGLSRTSNFAINPSQQSSEEPPRRRASPPRFHSRPGSESNVSPAKESANADVLWGGTPATTTTSHTPTSSSPPKPYSTATASSNKSASSANTNTGSYVSTTASISNNNDSSPPKKFTPLWKRTIPEMPAPAWGYAAGMVAEPHPKPKPPPVEPVVEKAPSPTKSSSGGVLGKLLKKKKKPEAKSPTKTTPQKVQPSKPANVPEMSRTQASAQGSAFGRYSYYQQPLHRTDGAPPPRQQPGPSAGGYARQPQPEYRGRQQEEDTGEEETEDGETVDETEETEETEEEEEEEEEEPPARYSQHRRQYSQPLSNHERRRSAYEEEVDSEDTSFNTPRRIKQTSSSRNGSPTKQPTSRHTSPTKTVLRPKAKVDPYEGYEDVSPIGSNPGGRRSVRPRLEETEDDEEEDETPRRRILRRDEVEVVVKTKTKGRTSPTKVSQQQQQFQNHNWNQKQNSNSPRQKWGHERSRSAYEEDRSWERERDKDRERERPRPVSAFGAPMSRASAYARQYEEEEAYEDDESVRLAYDYDDERDVRGGKKGGGTPVKGRVSPTKKGGKTPTRAVEDERWEPKNQGGRRAVNGSSGSASGSRYQQEEYEEPPRTGRRQGAGLPQPPAMDEANSRRFAAMDIKGHPNSHNHTNTGRSESRTSAFSAHTSASTGGQWPADLPRLPRTPGSSTAGESRGGYFDSRPGQSSNANARRGNLDLDDPPPQASVMRTPSPGPGGGYTFSQRQVPQQQQQQQQPKQQSRIQEQAQRRRSLYNEPQQPVQEDMGAARRRPQSQIYQAATSEPFHGANNGPNNHSQPSHHQFAQHHQPPQSRNRHVSQTPAPPPTVGIESPHPIGGRERLADIPRLEEESNDGSDHERVLHGGGGGGARVPRISIDSGHSGSGQSERSGYSAHSPNSGPPSIPVINVDSSPMMGGGGSPNLPMINVDPPAINVTGSSSGRSVGGGGGQGPKIQVFEVPGVSVSGPSFDDGPMINVSGPDDHSNHGNRPQQNQQHHGHHHGQQQSGPTRGSGFNGKPRPQGRGLMCGGCGGPIVGRIVSAMDARWHPSCFKCTVCEELLEHVSSFEHEGRPYCHLDYHENFAPRCYTCKTAIIDEQFISLDDHALGKRTYHTQHFFCAECGDPFLDPSAPLPTTANGEMAVTGDGEFEGFTVYKGHPYCEACHVRLRLPKCKRCKRAIRDHDEAVEALGGKWCWGCFVCASCNEPFENPSFFQRGDQPYCEHCFSIMLRNEI